MSGIVAVMCAGDVIQKGVTLLAIFLRVGLCAENYWDYVVVGAGPSGLQMGYFLEQAHRNYVILERSNTSGNF